MLWPFTAARRFPVNYALISTVTAEVCLRMAGVIASNVFFYAIGLHAELRGGAGGGDSLCPGGPFDCVSCVDQVFRCQ